MNGNVNENKSCPNCGKVLPAGALAGLCPVCLLAQGPVTDTAEAGVSAQFAPPTVQEITRLFPQLEVLHLLGAGGMGAVYKARQPALDRMVALKVLPATSSGGVNFAERFNREARALARLNHPNIVTVHEFGQAGGLHYFIMEFVDGANLRQLEQAGRLSPREALQIIPQICDALQYAHDEGVVHRDIKPENVLIDRKGRVKIADFGLAKILGSTGDSVRLTLEGQVMGTPHYMAPEQVERPLAVDHRADIYALGVVFYEMLTGDLPLGKFSPPSRKVQVDVRLDEVVLRALENDPSRRYQKVSEVKLQVETIAGTAEAVSDKPAPVSAAEPPLLLRWAGFLLVRETGDQRQVYWKGTLQAFAILFGLLTILFAFVSAVTGRSLMGWLGVVGWPSVVVRLLLAGAVIGFGLRHAWHLPRTTTGTVLAPLGTPWWRNRHAVLASLGLLALTWAVFRILPQPWRAVDFYEPSGIKVAQVAKRDASTGRWVARLPGRGTVELLAVGETNAAPNCWWGADGQLLSDVEYEVPNPVENSSSSRISKDLLFRVRDLPTGTSMAGMHAEPPGGVGSGAEVFRNGKPLPGALQARMAWRPGVRTADVQVGFALEAWRTIATTSASGYNQTQVRLPTDPNWKVNFHNKPTDLADGVQVAVIFGATSRMWVHQLVAVDTNAVEHTANNANGTPIEKLILWTYNFPRVRLAQLKEFRVQVRPVHWVEFPDVALAPRAPLPPPITVSFGPIVERAFDEAIDFDTGVITNFPPVPARENILAGLEDNIVWMQENGFDAAAGIGELQPLGMDFVLLKDADWETLTPRELKKHVFSAYFRPRGLKPANDSRTYGFRTREHGVGMLQLQDFEENKAKVNLRYKLVQRGESSVL